MRRAVAALARRCIDVISVRHLTLKQILLRLIGSLSILIFFTEFLVYYLVIWQCNWPHTTSTPSTQGTTTTTRIMLIADTHLLGRYRGHWLDKLKREWQMHRAFQTSVQLLSPEAIFFLGDLFDEGLLGPNDLFNSYTHRFHSLFPIPEGVKHFAVAGNHDIGFHNEIFPQRIDRFVEEFGVEGEGSSSPSVQMIEINNNIFVLINSMAMEGDGCRLCGEAEWAVERLALSLNCVRNQSSNSACHDPSTYPKIGVPYSRPILIQHFPLHRETDEECGSESGRLAPSSMLMKRLRPSHDCLSRQSTRFLINSLHPRAAFGGHSHYGCRKWWPSPDNFWEHTVPSFSWRNNHQPSFLLLHLSPTEINVNTCELPDEYTEIGLYILWGVWWAIALLRRRRRWRWRKEKVHA